MTAICGHKFLLRTCAACTCEIADKRVSKLHDALWHYDEQPTSRAGFEQIEWERHRDQINKLIWEIHDLLRPYAAPIRDPQEPA